MKFVNVSRFFVLLTVSTLLGACSGSSSTTSNISNAVVVNSPTDISGAPSRSTRALLPTADEPNTVGLQLAQSTDGVVHATYADLDGRIFYAQCQNNCGTANTWQVVEIDDVDVGFSGYAVPRLELDSQSRPRIAFHVSPGTFDRGNTHFAQCNANCLRASSWESAAVLGHGENMLKFRLIDTDWFALDSSGNAIISIFAQNGLLDNNRHLRILHCNSNCTANAGWDQRIVASYSLALGRPAHIEVTPAGQYHLALDIEGIGSDTSTLTWFGCSNDCLEDGAWSDGVSLQTLESDLNSIPHASLSVSANGNPSLLSFDNTDLATLTLHQCERNCAQPTNWVSANVSERINIEGGVYDIGYGVDLRADGNALEMVFAGKPEGSPNRQLVVASRCENPCATAGSTWSSRVLTRTDEQLLDEGVCTFIGTTITSGLSLVDGVVGFTAAPQWACGLGPVLVTKPDGERYFDNASDIRFAELATVVAF